MKKFLFFSLFISLSSFGQSVTISPETIDKQNSNTDDLMVTSFNKPPSIVGIRANGTVQAKTGVMLGDILMKIDGGGYDGFNDSFKGGRISFKATQNWGINNGGAITFETTPNTDFIPIERMIINHNGNVGIGIPTPTAQLDVARGTALDGTAIFRGTTHVSHFNYATNENTYIRGGKAGSHVIINDVVGLGNVGIGTITPQAKLHVSQGNLRVDAMGGNGFVNLYADDAGTVTGVLPIAFSVKNPNNQISIPNNTNSIFPFTTTDYNYGNFYNTSTYEFTAPINGIYHFDSYVTLSIITNTNASAAFILKLDVDGNSRFYNNQPLFQGVYKTHNLSQDIKLNAGQKVRVSIFQNSGYSQNIEGDFLSNFSGHLVMRL